MFHASWTAPQKEIKTVRVDQIPQGLGRYRDGRGGVWHVQGYGKDEAGWWAWMRSYYDLEYWSGLVCYPRYELRINPFSILREFGEWWQYELTTELIETK